MRNFALVLVKLLLWWLCFFAVGRLMFLLCYHHLAGGASWLEMASGFPHALRLDISASCYLMALPILLYAFALIFPGRLFSRMAKWVSACELLVCSLIQMGEIAVYGEWLSKLNYKILLYLRHPMEIVRTATGWQLFFSIAAVLLLCAVFLFLYVRVVERPDVTTLRSRRYLMPVALLLSGGLCFLGMRGGFNAIPNTQKARRIGHLQPFHGQNTTSVTPN